MDALVLQEAVIEAARQDARSSQAVEDDEDITELFGDSEVEAEPKVETRASRQAKTIVVKTSESEPEEQTQPQLALPDPRATPTKKRTRAQTSKTSKSSSTLLVYADRNK